MLVRERLTGLAPPAAARKMVDLWRPLLEDKIGTRLDRLDRFAEDQARFGDAVHDLLTALELGDDRNAESDDDDNQDDNRDGENDQSGAEGPPDRDAAQERTARREPRGGGKKRRPGRGPHRRDVGKGDGERGSLDVRHF